MERPTVGEIARDEATRQTVILGFMVVGGAVVLWASRAASNPDMWRTLRMRKALVVKRVAGGLAERFQTIATNAATAYNRERA